RAAKEVVISNGSMRRNLMSTATENMNILTGNRVGNGDIEDQLLRRANGIIDEIVFPRLRATGIAESDLHRAAMRLLRQVQAGKDHDGSIAELLCVVRCGVNGTRSRQLEF